MSAGRSGKSESAAVGGGVRSQSRWARCEAGRCEFQHHVGVSSNIMSVRVSVCLHLVRYLLSS